MTRHATSSSGRMLGGLEPPRWRGETPAELLRTAVPSPCHDVPVIRGAGRTAATQEPRAGEDEHGDR
jgi:hypothetical protein